MTSIRELTKLSTFGIGKDIPKPGWRRVIEHLMFEGVMAEDGKAIARW